MSFLLRFLGRLGLFGLDVLKDGLVLPIDAGLHVDMSTREGLVRFSHLKKFRLLLQNLALIFLYGYGVDFTL